MEKQKETLEKQSKEERSVAAISKQEQITASPLPPPTIRKSQGQEAWVRGREEERDCGGRRGDGTGVQRRPRCIAWKSGLERICRLSDGARGQLLYSNSSTDEGVLKEIILFTLQVVTLKKIFADVILRDYLYVNGLAYLKIISLVAACNE